MDEEKWNALVSQWEDDDKEEATDELESAKDAMDLAQPEAWAEHDLAQKPIQGPAYQDEAESDAAVAGAEAVDPDSSPVDSESAVAPARMRARSAPVRARSTPAPMPQSMPKGGAPDWQQLAHGLGLANASKGLSQGMESMFANIGAQSGYKPNAHAGEALTANARLPLDIAKERQGYESKAKADGVRDAMDNPNSLQSQKARDAVRTFFAGSPLPPGFDNWSANDVQKFASSGTLSKVADDKRRKEEGAAKATADAEKAAAKASADAAKATKADDELKQMRKTWTPELKAAGKDPTTASKFDIEQVMGVVKAREGRAFTAKESDEKDVKELAGKLSDPAVFEQRYSELQKLVKESGGEVPGIGVVEGMRQQPGVVGSVTRAVSPPSDAAIKGRKLLRQLAADYAREISGAGVSDTERANLNAATVDVDNDDSRIALAGLETLREMHAAKMAALKRGYKPSVVDRASGGGQSDHGKVVKETKSFRQFEDGYIEEKK